MKRALSGLRNRWVATGLTLASMGLSFYLLWPGIAGWPYEIGEIARTDVYAPADLAVAKPGVSPRAVTPPVAPATLVLLYDPSVQERSVALLRASCASARERFSAEMDAVYQRRHLTPEQIRLPHFRVFVELFQQDNASFPLSMDWASFWAQNEAGDAFPARLAEQLERVMESVYVIPGDLILPQTKGTGTKGTGVQLQTVSAKETQPFPETPSRAFTIAREDLITLDQAQDRLRGFFEPEEARAAAYVAGFLQPNCFPPLTGAPPRLEPKAVLAQPADFYTTGQLIVSAGERIGATQKAALDLLQSRPLSASAWSWLSLIGFSAILAGVWWRFMRDSMGATVPARLGPVRSGESRAGFDADWVGKRGEPETMAAPEPGALEETAKPALPLPDLFPPPALFEQRTQRLPAPELEAEPQAQKAWALVRAGLLPHLARWMMDHLVRKLIRQRSLLLETQKKGMTQAVELEQRLAAIQSQFQQRVAHYEEKIAGLEQSLLAKEAENRQMLWDQLLLAKQALVEERLKQAGQIHQATRDLYSVDKACS